MAFDFLGQFSREEYEEFIEFLDLEYESLDARISNLNTEIARNNTYINKLDKAEENLLKPYQKIANIKYNDGVEEVEVPYRTKISVLKNTLGLISFEDEIHDDIDSMYVMRQMKDSIVSSIKYKREKLEYIIKKAIDLSDQLAVERRTLLARKDDIDDLKEKINETFQDPDQKGVVEVKKETVEDKAVKTFINP